ncbi:MAG: non-canonical purine NTP pyrophosphatase, partial [Coriobacteriia bacterium]|nr:non-canonical purine NTP pyrophosphatase [Coriobacteriia bacterium]
MSSNPEGGIDVVVGSSNHGKLAEIRSALDFPGWRFVAASELEAEWPSPEEDGETFEDNARIKARAAHERFE